MATYRLVPTVLLAATAVLLAPGVVVAGTGQAAPDLAVIALARPPAAVPAGGSFDVTDTAANQGDAPAAASTTRYYISSDQVRDASDIRLAGNRPVPALPAGSTNGGSRSVTIPADAPVGRYYVIACADDTRVVPESDETDNCLSSANRIRLTAVDRTDLLVLAISDPPAARTAGGSFPVADTTGNVGVAPAPASATQYFLSLDGLLDAADVLLTSARVVPALDPGDADSGARVVGIPSGTPAASYFLLGCADGPGLVLEANETNCLAAAAQIRIGAAGAPAESR